MGSHARLHAELTGVLRQHCPVCDERHLALLGWMVTGLLLSQTVCFGHWQRALPLQHCLAASWQRRCRRWLSNQRIDVEALYGPLVLWAIQHWQKPGQALHLALDTTVLWNRYCVVVLSVICHGRAIPLLWQTFDHPSASVSADVVIGLLQRADQLLADFAAITLLGDRGLPSAELLGWFEGRERWSYVMRLRGDTDIHGTAAPMGCQVRRLRLARGHCRGLRDVQLWSDGCQRANLVLARPVGIRVSEPWHLVSNRAPTLDLVWAYGQRFCCAQLFRDQKSGFLQLDLSRLRDQPLADRSVAACGRHRCADQQSASAASASAWIHTGKAASTLLVSVCTGYSRASSLPAVPCCPGCRSHCRPSSHASPVAVSAEGSTSPGSPESSYPHRCRSQHRGRSHDRLG